MTWWLIDNDANNNVPGDAEEAIISAAEAGDELITELSDEDWSSSQQWPTAYCQKPQSQLFKVWQ